MPHHPLRYFEVTDTAVLDLLGENREVSLVDGTPVGIVEVPVPDADTLLEVYTAGVIDRLGKDTTTSTTELRDYGVRNFSTIILTDLGWTMPLALSKVIVYAGVPLIYEAYAVNHWQIFSCIYEPTAL